MTVIIYLNTYILIVFSVVMTFTAIVLGQRVYDIIANIIKAYKSKHTTRTFFKSVSTDKK